MRKVFLVLILGIFLFSFVNATTYTASTDTNCENGTCVKTLYSGIRNVYEGNQWKKVEDAKSLMGKGFNVILLEDDKDFPIEIVDFNSTSIQVKLNPNGLSIFNKDVPVRIWKQNQTKEEIFKQDIIDGKIIEKGLEDYKEKMDKIEEEFIGFNLLNQEEEKIYNFGIGDYLEFGFNSTTIMLQENETENLDDTYVSEGSVSTNYGTLEYAYSGGLDSGGDNLNSYYRFNISAIPGGNFITDSEFCLWVDTNAYDTGETATARIYELDNDTWDEEVVTWDKQPTGVGGIIGFDDTIDGDDDDFWLCLNASSWVDDRYTNSKLNVSFKFNSSLNGTTDYLYTRTKEFATSGLRPYLNITYWDGADLIPPTFTTIPNNESIIYGDLWDGVFFNATDETGFDTYSVNDSSFTINDAGFLNMTNLMGVGTYELNVSINDTSNNMNYTIYALTINQATPSLSLSGSSPITYGTTTDFSGSGCPAQVSCSLNISNRIFGVGGVIGNYSTSGNENYTGDSDVLTITINQATPTGSLSGTSPIVIGTEGDVVGSESNAGNSDVTYTLFRNGAGVSNPDTSTLGVGVYSYIYNTTGGTNYSSSASLDTFELTISGIPPTPPTEPSAYIAPLDLPNIFQNVLAGSPAIFMAIFFIGFSIASGYFRLHGGVYLLLAGLAGILLYGWFGGGLYIIVIIVGGLITYWTISRLVK